MLELKKNRLVNNKQEVTMSKESCLKIDMGPDKQIDARPYSIRRTNIGTTNGLNVGTRYIYVNCIRHVFV